MIEKRLPQVGSALLTTLACLVLLALVACGGEKESETPTPQPPEASTAPVSTAPQDTPPEERGINAPTEGDGESPTQAPVDQTSSESVSDATNPESIGTLPSEPGG